MVAEGGNEKIWKTRWKVWKIQATKVFMEIWKYVG
jgi:hypothetical protein